MGAFLNQCKSLLPKMFMYGTLPQKATSVALVPLLLFVGCAGTAPNPVDRYILGDEKKSARALYAEVASIDEEIVLKNKKKTDRDIWNVVFFVTGFLVIVPWFFIDSKGSHEVEIEALKARKTQLMILYAEKGGSPPSVVGEEEN